MYVIEPFLKEQREKTDLRLMAASIYAGYAAYYGKPDELAQDERRLERSIAVAKSIMERTR